MNFDGTGRIGISTSLPFFNHMLTAFGSYGGFDLTVHTNGNTEVDTHHTVEDIGIVMGQAFVQALGDKSDIHRFDDCYISMDEALAHAAIDVSGRPCFVGIGEPEWMPTVVTSSRYATAINEHSFESSALSARIALYVRCPYGRDPHHITEVEYKAVARVLRATVEDDPYVRGALSAKGTL